MEALGSTSYSEKCLILFPETEAASNEEHPAAKRCSRGRGGEGIQLPEENAFPGSLGICFLQQRQAQTPLTHNYDKCFAS